MKDPKSRAKPLDTWFVDQDDRHYPIMYQLYSRARRQALGIAQRLESVKDALRPHNAIPEKPDEGPRS